MLLGTGSAQLIPLLITPVLARLYDPVEFGEYGSFLAFSNTLALLATGRMELAVVSSKSKEDGINIASIGFVIATSFAVAISFVVLFLDILIDVSNVYYFLPVSVFFAGILQLFNSVLIHFSNFAMLSKARVASAFLANSFQLFGGVVGLFEIWFLAISQPLGQASSMLLFIWSKRKVVAKRLRRSLVRPEWRVFYDNKKFAIFDGPSSLLHVLIGQGPIVILGARFGAEAAAMFFMCQRVLQAPVNLLAGSVFDVFKNSSNEEYNETGSIVKSQYRVLKTTSIVSIFPALLLLFFAVPIFSWVLGEEWSSAGEIASVLAIPMFFRFVAKPLGFAFYLFDRQGVNLLMVIGLFIATYISLFYSEDFGSMILWYAISYVTFYLLQISFSLYLGKKR